MQHKLVGLTPNKAGKQTEVMNESVHDIAIIGVALRLPGADNLNALWDNLCTGKCHITTFPDTRKKDIDELIKNSSIPQEQRKYGVASYLDRIDLFDHNFFSITPTEAVVMDPHQRIFNEVVHEAIEDAGYGGKRLFGSSTGIYLAFNSKKGRNYEDLISLIGHDENELTFSGNIPTIMAGRVAYQFDLSGPNMLVDTACSSSLVCVHLACQALRNGECNMAIAAGITLNLAPFDIFRKHGIESDDGMTRAFDDLSSGTGTGEGVVAVFLKPLHTAIAEGDDIYCVIKGTHVNHDGRSNGLTAPNPRAQSKLLLEAWQNSGVMPETIGYIEAHGTGTVLGDPIEVQAISEAFKHSTDKKQFCGIGSIKTNLGHLDVTAGIVGLVKALLALKHKTIPPSLFFTFPNRNIDFINSPVYVCDRAQHWQSDAAAPRRAGVNSFGISGTNCHVVLEEYTHPETNHKRNFCGVQVFTLSTKNRENLLNYVSRYINEWETISQYTLQDICHTANVGRAQHNVRLAMIVSNMDELYTGLVLIQSNGLKAFAQKDIYASEENDRLSDNSMYTQTVSGLFHVIEQSGVDIEYLRKLCGYYCMGAPIDWERLYQGEERNSVHIPTYPFSPIRCWPVIKSEQAEEKDIQLYYQLKWVKEESAPLQNTVDIEYKTLIIANPESQIIDLAKKLAACCDSYLALTGNAFVRTSENHYTVRNTLDDFIKLFTLLPTHDIRKIVYIQQYNENEQKFQDMFYGDILVLHNLVKASISAFGKQRVEFVIVTTGACMIAREDELMPSAYALFNMGKAVAVDRPSWTIRAVDVGKQIDQKLALQEILLGNDMRIALRQDVRYGQLLTNAPIKQGQCEAISSSGNYVITGGCGAIGLCIAQWLASYGNVHITLVSRNAIAKKQHPENADKLNTILSMGATIDLYDADVSDKDALSAVLASIRRKRGRINGIFHAAGIVDQNSIGDMTQQQMIEVLAPKTQGTLLLDSLTRKDNLDFFVLISSVASVFPLKHLSAYSIANSFLSAFAIWRSTHVGKTLCLDYSGWEFGIGAALNTPHADSDCDLFVTITHTAGITALEHCLELNNAHTIIGQLNAHVIAEYSQKEQWRLLGIRIDNAIMEEFGSIGINNRTNLCSIKISGREDSIYTDSERMVAAIWCNLMGFEQVNIDDDFFEIGGHSLLAIQLESELRKQSVEISGEDIFMHSTVEKMARFIDELKEVPSFGQ